ncbi:MAG: 50S ribosomal protein L24 [Planctomycetes bacterium]|nr:50S ribosomal protein L24 [Planctomycetota bacterium]
MHIRRNDVVVIRKAITGCKDTSRRPVGQESKGSRGRVLKVLTDKNQVIVEGVNYKYRHVRPSQKNPQGGRMTREAPVHVSNVMLFCDKCQKGVNVRIERVPKDAASGATTHNVLRYCKVCGELVGVQD